MIWRGAPGLMVRAALVGAIAISSASVAAAQLGCSGSTCTVEISLPVADVMRISLSNGNVNLGNPSEADYALGYRDVSGPALTATVKANRPYIVQAMGNAATFLYGGAFPDPGKPASDLLWSTSQAGLSSATNNMGSAGIFMQGNSAALVQASMYLRTLWSFASDVPGNYSLAIRFTLSTP